MFWYIKHKTLNIDIWNDLKHEKKSIKKNHKWVIATEPMI